MLLLITNKIDGLGLGAEATKRLVGTVRRNLVSHSDVRETLPETNLQHEYLKFSEFRNGSNLDVFGNQNNPAANAGIAFMVTSLLAVLGHTTNVLDKLGVTVSNLVKYGLDAISLTLGTISAAGYLSEDTSGNESIAGNNNPTV